MARPKEAAPLAKIAPPERLPGLRERPPAPRHAGRFNRRLLARLVLVLLGPLVLLAVGLYFYLAGGRYVATDDAYVKADKIPVSADVAGRVIAVPVVENQRVKAGDVLFRLDDEPYRIALEGAKARLAAARNDIEALKASYRQRLADIAKAQDTVAYYQRNVERNRGLHGQGVVSQQILEDSEHSLNVAQQTLAADKQDLARVVAALGGNPDLPIEQQAAYLDAKSAVDKAELQLTRLKRKLVGRSRPRHGNGKQLDLNAAGPAGPDRRVVEREELGVAEPGNGDASAEGITEL